MPNVGDGTGKSGGGSSKEGLSSISGGTKKSTGGAGEGGTGSKLAGGNRKSPIRSSGVGSRK